MKEGYNFTLKESSEFDGAAGADTTTHQNFSFPVENEQICKGSTIFKDCLIIRHKDICSTARNQE